MLGTYSKQPAKGTQDTMVGPKQVRCKMLMAWRSNTVWSKRIKKIKNLFLISEHLNSIGDDFGCFFFRDGGDICPLYCDLRAMKKTLEEGM